ncbi:PREDICTED: CLAVATA3/ESR (CLE)-related protein 26-like [Brassica oleracea var. oleracea]|uniref:CLAVATA3/ESR (CLE)-related protein 26-like n=1 Tax=Brassica oleracea var. oleracea TaxID=109376 RepID=UPI0006A7491F|nr:PREDICTED: CLAVATA3/ESR (CLE)-related protein 26-like [Brassica oleracea var. oleracea]
MRNLQSLRLQLLFCTLFTIGLVTLLMIDAFVLENNSEAKTAKEITAAKTINNSIVHAKEVQQELEDRPSNGDLIYAGSKRTVPRGPDPIHNRRAGNSGRPPGSA